MEDGHAFDLGGGFEAADPAAPGVGPGIALRGHDHGQRGLGVPAQIHVPEHALGGAEQELAEVGHEPRQQRLALGIAEADVELEQLGAVLGQHQAGIEHAPIGRALGRHAGDGRADDLGERPLGQLRRQAGCRGIGAHAARVRTAVALAYPLVVLRGAERQHVLAVDQSEQARLLAAEAILDDDRLARHPKSAAKRLIEGVESLLDGRRDGDALTRGEPVRLDHDRGAARANVGSRRIGRGSRERPMGRGRDAVANAEGLGEGLGALEAGGRGARPKCLDPRRLQPVDQTEHERQLGPGNDQLDRPLAAEGDDAVEVVDGERHAGRFARDRVATRSAEQLAHQGRGGERPAERMLAPARPDDHDPHVGCATRCPS